MSQAVAPAARCIVPAVHGAHDDDWLVAAAVPGGHTEQCASPSLE
jgi:hypothetical protein